MTNRHPTLSDVARLAGVSKMTVSRVLNGQRKNSPHEEAILRAVQELNFEVNPHAKRLSMGRDYGSIGFFVTDIDLGVGTLTLRRIQSLLTHAGYRVPLYSLGAPEYGDEQVYASMMADLRLQRPQAIIASGCIEGRLLEELDRFQHEGGVVALYGCNALSALQCDQILFDEEDNTYQAARHLLELGHRTLGFYKDGLGPVEASPRYAGFRRALKEFGGKTRTQWLVHGGDFDSGRLQEGGGMFLADQFLRWKQRPTAMCIVNDHSAVAFIGAVGRAGVQVPQDVSVVGHDDLPIAAVFPVALTTVSHPVVAIANGVAEMLTSRLSGDYRGPPRHQIVRGELRVRESAISSSK